MNFSSFQDLGLQALAAIDFKNKFIQLVTLFFRRVFFCYNVSIIVRAEVPVHIDFDHLQRTASFPSWALLGQAILLAENSYAAKSTVVEEYGFLCQMDLGANPGLTTNNCLHIDNYFMSLSLALFICKVGIIIVVILWFVTRNKYLVPVPVLA